LFPRKRIALANELLPGGVRPSDRYLTGFLVPSGTSPERSAGADEDDDLGYIPESAGLAEENNEARKAAKKGLFPSSMELSFSVPKEARAFTVVVRDCDRAQANIDGADGRAHLRPAATAARVDGSRGAHRGSQPSRTRCFRIR
jgi:hypothetical protein